MSVCYISAPHSLSEKNVTLCKLLHLHSSLLFLRLTPLPSRPFCIFISSSTDTAVAFYFNLIPNAAWYSASGAPPPPKTTQLPSVQSASSDTDGLVSIPPRTTKFHNGLELLLHRNGTLMRRASYPACSQVQNVKTSYAHSTGS